MRYRKEPPYTHGTPERTGVLLVNLGTPDAPTAPALRRYLKQFLGDPRVVEAPRLLWWFILNGIILNTRPKKSAAKYASIWLPQGSPLAVHSARMASLVAGQLHAHSRAPLVVEYAMRYGSPAIPEVLARLKAQNCQRLLVLPLYPQYSASTSATVSDIVFRELQQMRNLPALRMVKHFHDHPGYIQAVATSIQDHWALHGEPEVLVMSFHGLPRAMLDQGDPYHCECLKSGRLIAAALGLAPERYRITFQSRFGRAEWLRPYTSATLQELGQKQTRRVDVVCPGFVADCLETLEEIAQEGKETFQHAGGGEYHYIPCLNENPQWISALTGLILDNLHGWLEAPDAAALEQSRQRALQHGAER